VEERIKDGIWNVLQYRFIRLFCIDLFVDRIVAFPNCSMIRLLDRRCEFVLLMPLLDE